MKNISLLVTLSALIITLNGCGGDSDTTTDPQDGDQNSVTISHRGLLYNTITSPSTGRIWLDRNLGATRTCTTVDDENCYGDLYQWGRDSSGHEKRNSQTTETRANSITSTSSNFITIETSPDPTVESYDWVSSGVDDSGEARRANWSKTDGTSVCPLGFRVPTANELIEEVLNDGGVANRDDGFTHFLKLPAGGKRDYHQGAFATVGSRTYLWASDIGDGEYRAQNLQLTDITALWIDNVRRASSGSIRCITDYLSTDEIPNSRENPTLNE